MRRTAHADARAHHHVRRHSARLLGAGLAGALAVAAATVFVAGVGQEGWALAARHTARFSVLWFLVAFAVGVASVMALRLCTRLTRFDRRTGSY